MKIGITYDTAEMYTKNETNDLHFDFAEYASINQIKTELIKIGCQVTLIGNKDNLIDLIKSNKLDFDLIYNTVEGINSRNREGLVPSILEACNIKYMGTDAFGLSLTLDKALMKSVAEQHDIKTPKYCLFENDKLNLQTVKKLSTLSYPVIIKPNYEGNSSGIKVVKSYSEALKYTEQLLEEYKTSVLCEEFIFGTEITVPVIGNDEKSAVWGITTVDIQQSNDFWLDINTKVFGNYKNLVLNVSAELKQKFKEITFKLFKIIGCKDFARFDFRLSKNNEIYFIEANPLPSLFEGGAFDLIGRANGLDYSQTLKLLVNTAAERLSIPKI